MATQQIDQATPRAHEVEPIEPKDPGTVLGRLKLFLTVNDSRFEDLERGTWPKTVYRDLSAGLIVAMTAIPMAMGFAMASGLRPEQGIIAGAVACLVGRTFGGSKYQVYGPTAAFIPVIAAMVAAHGHGFVVFVSILSGLVLMAMGLGGLGRIAKRVPSSIVVGFTVGIAVAIAISNLGEALGYRTPLSGGLFKKLAAAFEHRAEVNPYALGLALLTFLMSRYLLKVSIFIPAPLLALGTATLLAATLFAGKGVVLVADRYGSIPTDFFVFTPPVLPELSARMALDVAYFVVAIVFVSGVESLLCSSMADRLAVNKKTLFNPDKEFWGQGLVQVITPLLNGFPCTGALARSATSIKAGAQTPLAGYFKGVLKLAMAYYLARWLELVPMACIGGILLWVATNMVKPAEIREVMHQGRFEAGIMIYTALMVPLTDFLTGVLSALVLYFVLRPFLGRKAAEARPAPWPEVAEAVTAGDEPVATKS